MISVIRKFFLIIPLILAASCVKNEFNMEFALPQETNSNYKVTYYASDKRGGLTVETAAPIANGKGTLKGIAKNPCLLYISASSGQDIVVYVERGDKITVSGDSRSPYSWNVGGNGLNENWSKWRQKNAEALQNNDIPAINKGVAEYVEAHPSDPLSTLLLLTSFSRMEDETLFRSLWLKLTGDARDPQWTAMAGRADIPDNYLVTPAKMTSMAVRSMDNGIDTIRTDKTDATILYFWYATTPDRKEHMETLRDLSREFPDSGKRVIADICLEHDSVAWRSPLRRDSLEKAVRGWTPAGLADSRLMALDIPRAPFFIVFSRDGNQRYRGSDPTEATRAFRKLVTASK